MKKYITLIKNIVIYGLGTALATLINFLLLPLYTRYLTPVDYGNLDLCLTIPSFLFPIITLGLSDAVIRFFWDQEDHEYRKSIVSSAFNTILLTTTVLILMSLFLGRFDIVLRFFNNKVGIMLAVGITSINAYREIFNGLFKVRNKALHFTLINNSTLLLQVLIAIYLVVGLKMGSIGVLIATLIGSCIGFILSIYYNRQYLDFMAGIDFSLLSKMLKYSIPMVPNILSWWLVNLSDRFIISFWHGNQAVGYYSVANKIAGIILIWNNIFSIAWQWFALDNMKKSDSNQVFGKVISGYFAVTFLLTLVIISFGGSILEVVTTKSYFEAINYIPILALAVMFYGLSTVAGTAFVIEKRSDMVLKTTLIGAGFNLLFNIAFVPKWGAVAAAVSTLLSYMLIMLTRIPLARQLGFKPHLNYRVAAWLTTLIIVITIIYSSFTLVPYSIRIVTFVSIMFLLVYLYKSETLLLLKTMIGRGRVVGET